MSAKRASPKAKRASPKNKRPAGKTRAALAAAAVVVAAGSIWLLTRRPPPEPVAAARDNILLITLDTTRADRLGCYGYAAARTPRLDRLAAEGVRFERVYATAPITLPSHASIFTGLYPFEHGVRNNGNFYLAEGFETLATILGKQGYRTAAFVSTFILDRRYGLARGFETYDDTMEGAQAQVLALEAERRGDRTALPLSHWLEGHAAAQAAPFFVWLHLYDPHEPYRPPPPFRDAFAARPYDGEIAFDDAVVAFVLDKLEQLGVRDRTLIAVTADHGESLGDHGEETHSMFLYEAAIRVPLILWRPGRLAPRVVKEPVRTIDLAPTLLELAGAPALKAPHARSLLPLIEGRRESPAPVAYAETYLPRFYMNWAPLRVVVDGRYKLIDAPHPELYDLDEDPAEERNAHETRPEIAERLQGALQGLTAGSDGSMSVSKLDREALEKLAALGYLGAGAEPTGPARDPGRKDPKDVIQVFNRLRRANSAVRERRFAEALPILREVLAEDPSNAFARLVLGSAHSGMGQPAQAIEQYRKYVELVPTSSYAHLWIAICYLNLGDRDGALREADAALALDARFTDARVLRAGVLAARSQYETAIAELRSAVATDPGKPAIRLDLAKVLAEAGQPAEARRTYDELLREQPDFAPALIGLAALQASSGELEGAAQGLRRALDLDPRQLNARFNLAQVLERQQRLSEARLEYQRLAQAPETPATLRAEARRRLETLGR